MQNRKGVHFVELLKRRSSTLFAVENLDEHCEWTALFLRSFK